MRGVSSRMMVPAEISSVATRPDPMPSISVFQLAWYQKARDHNDTSWGLLWKTSYLETRTNSSNWDLVDLIDDEVLLFISYEIGWSMTVYAWRHGFKNEKYNNSTVKVQSPF